MIALSTDHFPTPEWADGNDSLCTFCPSRVIYEQGLGWRHDPINHLVLTEHVGNELIKEVKGNA